MSETFQTDAYGKWIYKDPSAALDYAVDWSDWLDTDTIASVAWTVPTGLTNDSSSETSTVATIWLSGGTVGNVYTVTCRVTTAASRVDERSFRIKVIDR